MEQSRAEICFALDQFYIGTSRLFALVQQYEHPVTKKHPGPSQYNSMWCVASAPTDKLIVIPIEWIHCRAMLLYSHKFDKVSLAFVATLVHEDFYNNLFDEDDDEIPQRGEEQVSKKKGTLLTVSK